VGEEEEAMREVTRARRGISGEEDCNKSVLTNKEKGEVKVDRSARWKVIEKEEQDVQASFNRTKKEARRFD